MTAVATTSSERCGVDTTEPSGETARGWVRGRDPDALAAYTDKWAWLRSAGRHEAAEALTRASHIASVDLRERLKMGVVDLGLDPKARVLALYIEPKRLPPSTATELRTIARRHPHLVSLRAACYPIADMLQSLDAAEVPFQGATFLSAGIDSDTQRLRLTFHAADPTAVRPALAKRFGNETNLVIVSQPPDRSRIKRVKEGPRGKVSTARDAERMRKAAADGEGPHDVTLG